MPARHGSGSDAPVNARARFTVDGGQHLFSGFLTITKKNLTVFEVNNMSEEPIFVGAVTVPTVQFYRHKYAVTLMRGNNVLFEDVALSARIDTRSSASTRNGDATNPASWVKLQMDVENQDVCDQVVEALLLRHAEELMSPSAFVENHPASTQPSCRSIADSARDEYQYHNHYKSPKHVSRSRGKGSDSQHSSHSRTNVHSELHEAVSIVLDQPHFPVPRSSSARSSNHSRRQSRHESVPATPNQLSEAISLHDSRLPSHRSRESIGCRSTSRTSHGSNHFDRSVDCRGSTSRRSSRDSRYQRSRSEDPQRSLHQRPAAAAVEREFQRQPVTAGRSDSRQSLQAHERANGRSSAAPYTSHVHSGAPPTASDTYADFSYNASPRSTVTRHQRGEQNMFVHSVQKIFHHRLHFMQYLHKEMVHQAFLVEEARLRAGRTGRSASSRRNSSVTPRSPHRSRSIAAEEAARLIEIESRLRQVEKLHREAEREREEVVRLRKELEGRCINGNGRHNKPVCYSSGVNSARGTPELSCGSLGPQAAGGSLNRQLQLAQLTPQPCTGYRQSSQTPSFYPEQPIDESDFDVAIVDRYVYGNEWGLVYPACEEDVRFNALIDVSLTLKLPRRLVAIRHLTMDPPGLRVTVEVRYNPIQMNRDVVERRLQNAPFRMLQRLYEMRDLFAASRGCDVISAGPDDAKFMALTAVPHNAQRGSSPRKLTQRKRGPSSSSRRPSRSAQVASNASSSSGYDGSSLMLPGVTRRREALQRRADDLVNEQLKRMEDQRERVAEGLRRHVQQMLDQVEEDERYGRENLFLYEAKQRGRLHHDARRLLTESLANYSHDLEEQESIDRATLAVGAARQCQTLMAAHRRQMAFLHLAETEGTRRKALLDNEAIVRTDLHGVMNPNVSVLVVSQIVDAEAARRAQLLKTEDKTWGNLVLSIHLFLGQVASESIADLIADESAARTLLTSDEVSEWADMLFEMDAPNADVLSVCSGADYKSLRIALEDDEHAKRQQIESAESHRHMLYLRESIFRLEEIMRDEAELLEMDQRGIIFDNMIRCNRNLLERRINEREQLFSLIGEEQFYRRTIVQDEQDAFEVLVELFATSLKDALSRGVCEEEDGCVTPRRRRLNLTPRTTKPFHYMTFVPDDMDHPSSAALALDAMLGCSINKNLEVVSISCPLVKAEEEDLQFQAGDMILDVAGHSLHSLSHLREVLSARAMQVQAEAREEFPDVAEEDLTTSPALQKYIEVLCEHHNFLVQVLRGCDIFQIIVKS